MQAVRSNPHSIRPHPKTDLGSESRCGATSPCSDEFTETNKRNFYLRYKGRKHGEANYTVSSKKSASSGRITEHLFKKWLQNIRWHLLGKGWLTILACIFTLALFKKAGSKWKQSFTGLSQTAYSRWASLKLTIVPRKCALKLDNKWQEKKEIRYLGSVFMDILLHWE